MILSFWRYSHLTLALFSALFLIVASTTGVVLAIDAFQEKTVSYRIPEFETISIQESLTVLQKKFPEIIEIEVNHNGFVSLQAIDANGNEVKAYINPKTGEILGKLNPKSQFIQWVTALHRSLFLKETGRFIVGFFSFLLALIAMSGFALLLKRQKGLRHFFSKIVKEHFAQYTHVILGRLAIIPILIIAFTGTYLTLDKFNFFIEKSDSKEKIVTKKNNSSFFENTLLSEVKKIEFPFSDDAEDYYFIQLENSEVTVNQKTGALVSEKKTPSSDLALLSLDLHTGRSNRIWAIILGISSASILYFIYSGFAISLKRRSKGIKNKFKADESEYILLVGSENGSTFRFANKIHQQLLNQGLKVHCSDLNNYGVYPKAKHLVIFTATHGLGDPPSNATQFISLLNQIEQSQKIEVSVVGFGSKSYPDFCLFAHTIAIELMAKKWAIPTIPLQTINDKSLDEFLNWVQLWSTATQIPLSTHTTFYLDKPKKLQELVLMNKTSISEEESTFLMHFRVPAKTHFKSGDLLAIYPKNNHIERFYSIGKNNGEIQLVVKFHPHGLGSEFLFGLELGFIIKASIIQNSKFHFPQKASKVVLIANGTGIAPFLGMIAENKKNIQTHLYCGFKQKTEAVKNYGKFAEEMMQKKHLTNAKFAFSRQEKQQYVMDLIKEDQYFFKDLLNNKGVILICGSLAMQKDVEAVLESFLNQNISFYKDKGQILIDCY